MKSAIAVCAMLVGCGSPAKPPVTTPPVATADAGTTGPSAFDVDPSVPDDLRVAVDHAQRVGRVLVAFDSAAAYATDLVKARGELDGVVGWLVLPRQRGALEIDFFTSADPPTIGRRVLLRRSGEKPDYEKLEPPQAAPPELATLFRARQLVIAAIGKPEQPINPVVFPGIAIEEEGIVVYLLAGTTKEDVAVLGKHYRARTNVDATKVLSLEPLSKGPIEQSLVAPNGGKPVGLAVTHIVSEQPLETHVFASLLHRLPVYVTTSRGIWKVNGDRISFQPKT